MDHMAINIVSEYIYEHLNKFDAIYLGLLEIYIVWKCKTLQNCKWLITSELPDGMYYEVTYNGFKNEYYLDVYKKVENRCIPDILESKGEF